MESKESDTSFINLDKARWQIAKVWLIGSVIPFLAMVIQSVLGKHGGSDGIQAAWSWFLPNIMPTLLLILGVLGSSAFQRGDRVVRDQFLELSWWLSAVYLFVVTSTLLLEVISVMEPAKLMTVSNYWLTPLQSLTAAAIGVLFTTQEEEKPHPSAPK